jgi:hypothetical protein
MQKKRKRCSEFDNKASFSESLHILLQDKKVKTTRSLATISQKNQPPKIMILLDKVNTLFLELDKITFGRENGLIDMTQSHLARDLPCLDSKAFSIACNPLAVPFAKGTYGEIYNTTFTAPLSISTPDPIVPSKEDKENLKKKSFVLKKVKNADKNSFLLECIIACRAADDSIAPAVVALEYPVGNDGHIVSEKWYKSLNNISVDKILFDKIFQVVERMHTKNFIWHQDLYSKNLLVNENFSRVVINDFGMAIPFRNNTVAHETGALDIMDLLGAVDFVGLVYGTKTRPNKFANQLNVPLESTRLYARERLRRKYSDSVLNWAIKMKVNPNGTILDPYNQPHTQDMPQCFLLYSLLIQHLDIDLVTNIGFEEFYNSYISPWPYFHNQDSKLEKVYTGFLREKGFYKKACGFL